MTQELLPRHALPQRKEILNNQLDEIMDSFDFYKVHEIMSALKWTWVTTEKKGIPDDYELRQEARRLMKQAINGENCATGGFRAWVTDGTDEDGPWTKLDLSFGLDTIHDGETHE
jgi:hypothetical protein